MALESKKYTLNERDFRSLTRGLLITLAGAGLTYATTIIPNLDLGPNLAFLVPFAALAVNTGLKWYEGAK